MVTDVAHVLCVVLLVKVSAQEDVPFVAEVYLPVHVQHRLLLAESDRVLRKVFHGEIFFLLHVLSPNLAELITCRLNLLLELLFDLQQLQHLFGGLLLELE